MELIHGGTEEDGNELMRKCAGENRVVVDQPEQERRQVSMGTPVSICLWTLVAVVPLLNKGILLALIVHTTTSNNPPAYAQPTAL